MDEAPSPPWRLHRWTSTPVRAVAWISFASGVGQFGVVSALGDVAKTFGHLAHGTTVADQAGLSGTSLGLGLAVIRLASLGALPLAAMADRVGRRRVLLAVTAIGLAITVLASASPGYWWFVAIFATGRPLLTAANSLCSVSAAEQTSSAQRAKAMALVAAAYGVGAGTTAILHSLAGSTLGFRGICLVAAVPLATIPFVARYVEEPERFSSNATRSAGAASLAPVAQVGRVADVASSEQSAARTKPSGWTKPKKTVDASSDRKAGRITAREWGSAILAATAKPYRKRLAVVALLGFFLSTVTGPANTFVFLFAQNVEHLGGDVTALLVVGAGVSGLLGLLAGRYAADRFGRRPTAMVSMMLLAMLATLIYSGSKAGLAVGYVGAVGVASVLAPAVASLINELFPTEVRASVNGWQAAIGVVGAAVGLLVFGTVADIGNRFATAAAATFLPAVVVAVAFWLLPETNRLEPEDFWTDLPPAGTVP